MESNAPQSNDYSDISETEQESSDSSESESIGSNIKSKANHLKRKRNAKTTPIDGSSAKKIRNETDFGTVSKLMKSSVAQGLRILKQEKIDHIEQIVNLQKEFNKAVAMNVTLTGQKWTLEQKVADTEVAKRNQTESFDVEKKRLLENMAALQEAHRIEKEEFVGEKKLLEQKIAALELNKTKKTCAHCQMVLDPVVFCNSTCGL